MKLFLVYCGILLFLRHSVSTEDNSKYRLPADEVKPQHYDIDLTLDENLDQFIGNVKIHLYVLKDGLSEIKIHSAVKEIVNVTLTLVGNEIPVTVGIPDPKTNILVLTPHFPLEKSIAYFLTFNYIGEFKTDMYGFYKSYYVDDKNETKYLASTQMEPVHARKAFPCFDEPSYKATFEIKLTYPKKFTTVRTNTPSIVEVNHGDGTITNTFRRTPKMATYLVAFLVSEFTCDVEPKIPLPFGVCSKPDSANSRKFAAEHTFKIMSALESVLTFKYFDMNMFKMDLAAIPDFAAGAMENWGLVTYRESTLLYDPKESGNSDKQRVATVIGHEFTHMWFGDLVTLHWWSDTFLNEALASYFEYFGTALVEEFKDWELEKQFVLDQQQHVFQQDAQPSSKPIHREVFTPDEISEQFGKITYHKGASIIRMISHMLGLTKFHEGLGAYIQKYKFENTKPENLWEALQNYTSLPGGLKLAEVIDNWITKPGYPVVFVKKEGDDVVLSQKRFFFGNATDSTKWYVPISYSTSSKPNATSTLPVQILKPTEDLRIKDALKGSKWILLKNLESAYYRANYDENLWSEIASALNVDSSNNIHELNKAGVVDDIMNLARAGQVKYSTAFKVTSFLSKEISYYPWKAAFDAFSFILRRSAEGSELNNLISKHILDLSEKLYESVAYKNEDDSKHIFTLNQVNSLSWLCKLGHKECNEEASKKFKEFKTDVTKKPSRNLKSIIFCSALRQSNDDLDWQFLWERFLETKVASEKSMYIKTLGCTKKETLLQRYLNYSITKDSGIRLQDADYVFTAVIDGNPHGVDIVLEFFVNNYNKIATYFQHEKFETITGLISSMAKAFTTKAQIEKLSDFIQTGIKDEAIKKDAADSIKIAETNLEWYQQYSGELTAYLNSNSAGRLGCSMVTLFLVFLSLCRL